MKVKHLLLILLIAGACYGIYKLTRHYNFTTHYEVGQAIDSLNGVMVYYNGSVGNNSGRTLSSDNYNIGEKYQCVEFVKRYYFEHLHHKMPDSYGHARDFFDKDIPDGALNPKRNLIQFTNGSSSPPKPEDLVVFSETVFNPYGHVAIISSVTSELIEIIQQNPGPVSRSRATFHLKKKDGKWFIDDGHLLGWLRK